MCNRKLTGQSELLLLFGKQQIDPFIPDTQVSSHFHESVRKYFQLPNPPRLGVTFGNFRLLFRRRGGPVP